MRHWPVLLLALALQGLAAHVQPWIELPVGTSRLTDLGAYRVTYQLYGQAPVEMPLGWSGQFTDDVGIAYFDAGRRGGRRAHVLHCPWRRGPGLVRLDYFLALPNRTPITLRFAIAMRPDITDKSDGVTYTATLTADGKPARLMHEHYTRADWKDFSFDLSPHAGKRVVLAFQAEPGPKNDSSFDFSMLAEPSITVVRDIDTRAALLREIVAAKPYTATARRDLAELANSPRHGIVPSTNDPHETSVEQTPTGYRFTYKGDDCGIDYDLPATGDGSLSGLTARVDGGTPFNPCHGGGVQFATDTLYGFRSPEKAELVSRKLEGDAVTLVWRYRAGEQTADVAWRFRLIGKALAIAAEASSPHLARLWLGQPLNRGSRRAVQIPYLNMGQAYFLRPQNAYVMSYLDWTHSMASRTPANEAVYLPRLDGTRNPLRERGYVAVSPEFPEVLPNIPHPRSPFLELLGPKVMLDIWGGSYDRGARLLRTLKGYGIDHAAVIWHNWQRYGYDVKLPDHLPANPSLGGDDAMKRLAAAAREVAYPFSLHENYIDFYPDAPSYDPKDVVLTPAGEFSKAWYHKGTKVQSFALKAGRMLHYARQNSPEAHRRFGTTAAYLDVHTCVPPWHHVDYDPKTQLAGTHHLKVNVHKELFQFERDTHGGPLFGEGNNHFFWAGLVDGVEAQVAGGEDRELLLDFDLLKLHPQMVNHGMGYYTRWLRTGRQTRWGIEAPTPAQLDKYRAQTIAYGHAAFLGSQTVYAPHLAWREHNIVQPVQALYGTAKATEILYQVGGKLVTSSAAIPCGSLDRVRVTYEGGLVVRVNLRDEDWAVGGHTLPQFGFLATAKNLLAYTSRRNGVVADYAENADALFADARTHVYRPWEQGIVDIEPRLKSLTDRGNGALDITYEWHVGQAPDNDYTAFVHFCDPKAEESDDIRFQNDHTTNPPTSAWKPGSVVTDGPHRVSVPAEQQTAVYDIVIGLYRPGAARLALRGTTLGSQRILIGRLAVERDAGRVKSLKLLPIGDVAKRQLARRKLFDERMNTAGTTVDFGTVRTDGSFKLYKRQGALELLPYPRDKAFTIGLRIEHLRPGAGAAAIAAVDEAGRRMGPVDCTLDGGWLTFQAGRKGASRFLITFPEARRP